MAVTRSPLIPASTARQLGRSLRSSSRGLAPLTMQSIVSFQPNHDPLSISRGTNQLGLNQRGVELTPATNTDTQRGED